MNRAPWNDPDTLVLADMLKVRVGNILGKDADLRITLNLDGTSITSKSHTHFSVFHRTDTHM